MMKNLAFVLCCIAFSCAKNESGLINLNAPTGDEVFYVVIKLPLELGINDFREHLNEINETNYEQERLKINPLFLGTNPDEKIPVMVVRRFHEANKAKSYTVFLEKTFRKNPLKDIIVHEIYPMSQNEYRDILRRKSL